VKILIGVAERISLTSAEKFGGVVVKKVSTSQDVNFQNMKVKKMKKMSLKQMKKRRTNKNTKNAFVVKK